MESSTPHRMSSPTWCLSSIFKRPSYHSGWLAASGSILFSRKQTHGWRFGAGGLLGWISGSARGSEGGKQDWAEGDVELWYLRGPWEALELDWLALQSCSRLRQGDRLSTSSMNQSQDTDCLQGRDMTLYKGSWLRDSPLPSPKYNHS